MIRLQSNRLKVEISEPMEGSNRGFRFDHAGFVSEVELDGLARFCASEPKNLRHPSTLGRGLCNEYKFDVSGEVGVGEWFPKFGVGLFRKWQDKNYHFDDTYPVTQLFPIHVSSNESEAVFVTEPVLCLGYALKAVKTIRVADNRLLMEIEATNAGDRPILQMAEYCHNFISIDGMALGSDYQLDLPQCPDFGEERLFNSLQRKGSFRGRGRGVTFCEFTAVDTDLPVDIDTVDRSEPFTWTLRHLGARAQVFCEHGFAPGEVSIWAVDHMVCPEISNVVDLAPGETKRWSYQWTFEQM